MSATGDELRDEVFRRFRVWDWQGAPARRYALLVAGYFRTRGPFFVEGEDKYLSLPRGDGLALVEWVEASADRPLTPTERADATARATAAAVGVQRYAIHDASIPRFDREAAVEYLRLALADPRRAAARLIQLPGAIPDDEQRRHPPPSYPSVRQVMECLCPAVWDHTATGWTPPPDAVAWARRVYEGRSFADLPVLADVLEEAGCPDRPLLDHCRYDGDHFRGCAAADRLLGN